MWTASSLPQAPTLCSHGTSSISPSLSSHSRSSMATSLRIAVVGDVHDDWSIQEDALALLTLRPDLVLFTGDFGNGNVDIVRSIANLDMTKAVILGNHDSFVTYKTPGKVKDPVQQQLQCLGKEHVGYRRLDFPTLKLSVVGGRPFSHGGEKLFQRRLLAERYGVDNMSKSANRIYEAALCAPEDHSIIFLAHNGPTGLGSNVDDICGRDWVHAGGDHGDPDLAEAIARLKAAAKFSIPLVVFGHMHKELAYGNGARKMLEIGADDTLYLNGAVVPRVKTVEGEGTSERSSANGGQTSPEPDSKGTVRAFTTVDIAGGRVQKVAETWVWVGGGDKASLEEEHVLYRNGVPI